MTTVRHVGGRQAARLLSLQPHPLPRLRLEPRRERLRPLRRLGRLQRGALLLCLLALPLPLLPLALLPLHLPAHLLLLVLLLLLPCAQLRRRLALLPLALHHLHAHTHRDGGQERATVEKRSVGRQAAHRVETSSAPATCGARAGRGAVGRWGGAGGGRRGDGSARLPLLLAPLRREPPFRLLLQSIHPVRVARLLHRPPVLLLQCPRQAGATVREVADARRRRVQGSRPFRRRRASSSASVSRCCRSSRARRTRSRAASCISSGSRDRAPPPP